jgi:hypothetical protein
MIDRTIYNNEKALELPHVFEFSKKKFMYSDYKMDFRGSGDACIFFQNKKGSIEMIAAKSWYVSSGCYIKCPENYTYIVTGVKGVDSGLYFMSLEKVS